MQLPQLVAVDTNVLLRLGDEDDEVIDAWTTIRSRLPGAQILVPPTVIEETVDKSRHDPSAPVRASAFAVLHELRSRWRLHPAVLNAADDAIVRNAAQKVRESGLLPYEEVNDALVLAEAAVLNCILLVSQDSHLRDINHEKLKGVFHGLDLNAPVIATPREIVKKFFR